MAIYNAIASVAVKDLSVALAWYEALFGKPADEHPMDGVAEWKFARGGWLQVYQLPERAGSGSFTLAIDSVEKEVARLDGLGIDTHQRTASPQVCTVMVTDPDGNHIALAEALVPGLAS